MTGDAATRSMATATRTMATSPVSSSSSPFIALGVLSSAITYETGRTTASKCRQRRDRIRDAVRKFGTESGVVMRFLLSANYSRRASERTQEANAALLLEAHREAHAFGDIEFLDTEESFHKCAWKKLLWYKVALQRFPSARYLAIADDDAYVQLAHLAADLRSVSTRSPYALYGLILWKAFFNAVSLEPSTFHSGWGYADFAAANLRERIERCRTSLATNASSSSSSSGSGSGLVMGRRLTSRRQQRRGGGAAAKAKAKKAKKKAGASAAAPSSSSTTTPACSKLPAKLVGIIERGEVHPSDPYPFASGPLFAVSRELGALLLSDPFPRTWLTQLESTPALRFYQQKGRVPFVLRKDACYPASFDAVLGWWVNGVIRRNNHTLSLVNTPFMIQHHPWVAFRHGAFSNKSIILHELKNPKSPGWAFAEAHGSGPFEPFRERVCGACEGEMRWSSVPGSHVARWECCGLRNDAEVVKEACRKDRRTRCVGAATAA